jgi:hypothetical protein
MKTYFGFAIADGMFPANCTVTRQARTVEQAEAIIEAGVESCCNASHAATISAMRERYGFEVSIPAKPPLVSLTPGDVVLVMSVRGLPRLDDKRHEYTAEEIANATFVFATWRVQ